MILRRDFLIGLTMAVLLSSGSCSDPTGSALQPPLSVTGCYQVTLGRWSGAHESSDPPRSIVILDSLGSYLLENGNRLVRPYPLGTPMPFDMAWWTRGAEEQLDLVFTDGGYVGVRLHFVWSERRWEGSAWAFTDVSPSVQATASSALSPRTCS